MVSALRAAAIAASIFMVAGVASAEVTKFNQPKFKGNALDWCLTWATDCGKPAADAYCKNKGYETAQKFNKWEDIGEPTYVFGSGQICNQEECDSFTSISCFRADAPEEEGEAVTYNKPKIGSWRVDWCLTWATDCGQPAADFYCKKQGHTSATAFKIANNLGKTKIYKTGETCQQPECDGFRYITCE
jgi:hypothetical protein